MFEQVTAKAAKRASPEQIPITDVPASPFSAQADEQANGCLLPNAVAPAQTSNGESHEAGRSNSDTQIKLASLPCFASNGNAADHPAGDILGTFVSGNPSERVGQDGYANHIEVAGALTRAASEFGHHDSETQTSCVELAPHHQATIDEIREQWRRRQSWHRAEKSLTLAAKAMCRRLVAQGEEKAELKEADALYSAALGKGTHPLAEVAFGAMFPIIEARDGMEKHRKAVEKRLSKLAKSLPVAPFIDSLRGVGIGSLAAIVGEAGNLSNYANPAKLWKRMGLAVMPDGRQRKVAGAAAIMHGYSPQRRSVMWNIGDCIVKAGGPLRELYDKRKAYEIEAAAAQGLTVVPANKIPKKDPEKYRSEGHVHNRAKRYVEKRVLLMIWRAWRDMR